MHEVSFPSVGDVLGNRYVIRRVLGSGGFARVYEAEHMLVGRLVAIKVLKSPAENGSSREERATRLNVLTRRFEREAKLVSQLRDPHTVRLHDFGRTDEGLLYMVLELVPGTTLRELFRLGGSLPSTRVIGIVRQALSSLGEAHAIGVIHRDIKPANLMLYRHDGRELVKVLDFGIAKVFPDGGDGQPEKAGATNLTASGAFVGTPRYVAPEQIRGDEVGPWTDIYSLGLVAYELLVGSRAVSGESSMNIVARHLDPEPFVLPESMGIPAGLRTIVERMISKSSDARYHSCEQVVDALNAWESGAAMPAQDQPVPSEPGEEDDGIRTLGLVAGAMVVGGILATGLLTILGPGESETQSRVEPRDRELAGRVVGDTAIEAPAEVTEVTEVTDPDQPDTDAGESSAAMEDSAERTDPTREAEKAKKSRRVSGATKRTSLDLPSKRQRPLRLTSNAPQSGVCPAQEVRVRVETSEPLHVRLVNLFGGRATVINAPPSAIRPGGSTTLGRFRVVRQGDIESEEFLAFGTPSRSDLGQFAHVRPPCQLPSAMARQLSRGRGVPPAARESVDRVHYRIRPPDECAFEIDEETAIRALPDCF